jgi:endonuclease YncB( thermonuclease family)
MAGVTPSLAQTWSGKVENIRDGDTIDIVGVDKGIRLYGIDAPEKSQTCENAAGARYLCGAAAAEALSQLVGRNGVVECRHQDWDRYGRSVSECFAGGKSLNARMVREGWAIQYDQYSDGRFDADQADAKSARRGLWAGTFQEPAQWRREAKFKDVEKPRAAQARNVPAEAAPSAPEGCTIKGNVGSEGRRIYHVTGQRDYERTQIDTSKGERWFCTAQEAEVAGWVAAKR